MPPCDQLEIISADGTITFYPLAPGGVTRIGRHPDNQVVISDPGITPFHAVLYHQCKPYQLLRLVEGGEVIAAGQSLPPNTPYVLSNGSAVQLNRYTLVLLEGIENGKSAISSGIQRDTSSPKNGLSGPLPDSNINIVTNLSEQQWVLEVGQTALSWLTVINKGNKSISLNVKITGVDDDWLVITPAQFSLHGREQKVVSITITPPCRSTSLAGTYYLTVMVVSSNNFGYEALYCSQQHATVVVRPYYEFTVGELSSRRQSLSRFERTAQFTLPLVNKSNCVVSVRLAGVDEMNACHFELQPPDEDAYLVMPAELQLSPGETIFAPVRTTVPPPPWFSWQQQVYHLTLTATLLAGRKPSRSVLAQVKSASMIGPWLASFLILGLAILVAYLTPPSLLVRPQSEIRQAKIDKARPPLSIPIQTTPLPDKPPPSETAVPVELTYPQMFEKAAAQHGLDWYILAGVAYQESRLDPMALGRDNDMGLMQIVPATWNRWAPQVGVSDPFDAYSNVQVAAAYLAYLRDYSRARGYNEEYWMLVGYNWGPNNLRRLFDSQGGWAQVPERQRQYVMKVMQAASEAPAYWQKELYSKE